MFKWCGKGRKLKSNYRSEFFHLGNQFSKLKLKRSNARAQGHETYFGSVSSIDKVATLGT